MCLAGCAAASQMAALGLLLSERTGSFEGNQTEVTRVICAAKATNTRDESRAVTQRVLNFTLTSRHAGVASEF